MSQFADWETRGHDFPEETCCDAQRMQRLYARWEGHLSFDPGHLNEKPMCNDHDFWWNVIEKRARVLFQRRACWKLRTTMYTWNKRTHRPEGLWRGGGFCSENFYWLQQILLTTGNTSWQPETSAAQGYPNEAEKPGLPLATQLMRSRINSGRYRRWTTWEQNGLTRQERPELKVIMQWQKKQAEEHLGRKRTAQVDNRTGWPCRDAQARNINRSLESKHRHDRPHSCR